MKNSYLEKQIATICVFKYKDFFRYNNVVGVGKGTKIINAKDTDEPCLTVLVEKKLPKDQLSKQDLVPKMYKNIKTDIIEVGEIKPLSLVDRIRPVIGGYSVGVETITAGTIGCVVYSGSGEDMKYYILSNNHVLANENKSPLGALIVQPGPIDGGIAPWDVIGMLYDYEPIKFITSTRQPENIVDCAIAKCDSKILNPEIYWIGYIKGITKAKKGMWIKKSGRTTGFTTGKVLATNVTVQVRYNSGYALFVRQVLTSRISSGGDSGSLVLTSTNQAVGLLFAGSSTVTVCNPIEQVLKILNVKLITN